MAPMPTIRLPLVRFLVVVLLGTLAGACAAGQSSQKAAGSPQARKIVFVAGRPSHGYGAHEHYAGFVLLAGSLRENVPGIRTVVHRNGWPKDPAAFDGADAIVINCDGGGGHVVMKHLDQAGALMKKGVGLACLHYATIVPKGPPGDLLKNWIGGYFETNWSVNPFWVAEFKRLPDHPIARGVRPFTIKDEWYYHMRFQPRMKGVTPILTAVPPDDTRRRKDGAYSGNPHVRARGWACRNTWRGRTSGRAAAAASASPACTGIGTLPTTASAASCSTPSCGLPGPRCRRAAYRPSGPRSTNSKRTSIRRSRRTGSPSPSAR